MTDLIASSMLSSIVVAIFAFPELGCGPAACFLLSSQCINFCFKNSLRSSSSSLFVLSRSIEPLSMEFVGFALGGALFGGGGLPMDPMLTSFGVGSAFFAGDSELLG